MGDTFKAIGAIVSAIGGLFGIGKGLFGGESVHIPSPPNIQLPAQDLQALTQQIQQNQAISDQARQAAVTALQQYNMGQLSPSYQSMYDEYARQLIAQAKQRAAAQGFTENSSQYQNLMALTYAQLQNYKGQLLQKQLNDAIQMTGLSETTINELKTKLGIDAQQKQLELQKWQIETQAELLKNQLDVQKDALIGQGIGQLGASLGDISKSFGGDGGSSSGFSGLGTVTSNFSKNLSLVPNIQNSLPGIEDVLKLDKKNNIME